MITFEDIKNHPDIRAYIQCADDSLAALGFTEHSFAHVTRVADTAETLGYSPHEVELVQIAGFLHDIGNVINRMDHSQSGAVMAFRILDKMGMPAEDIATVIAAIGNHDEGYGVPVNAIAAALILADKSDVRRSRVRNQNKDTFDIYDRVNYSVEKAVVKINEAHTVSAKADSRYQLWLCDGLFYNLFGAYDTVQKSSRKIGYAFSADDQRTFSDIRSDIDDLSGGGRQ